MGSAAVQTPFDTFAKGIIEAALETACAVSIQQPAALDALYADALIEPRAGAEALLPGRGMLGRMSLRPCVIDPFAVTPGGADLHRCVARASMLRAGRADALPLWVISQGVPRNAVLGWRLAQGVAWGDGVYLSEAELAPRVVAVSRLPRARDTMLLRLMGRGAVLDDALRDYNDLPSDAWERGFVPRLLLRVRDDLRRMGSTAHPDPELRMRYAEIAASSDRLIEGFRDEGRREGLSQGRAEALREAVAAVCEVLEIPIDPARRARIAAADGDALAAMLEALRRDRALP
jgi:hypothetical protein